jgi:hypothetical protein
MADDLTPRFPSGTCQGFSPAWQKIGTTWKPVGLILSGECISPIRFKNGTRDIIVRPEDANDPDFRALAEEFPEAFKSAAIVDALGPDDTAALVSKYPDDVKVGLATSPPLFAMPLVPRESMRDGVDITPNLPPELKAVIFDRLE